MRKRSKEKVVRDYKNELERVWSVVDASNGKQATQYALAEWAVINAYAALEELLFEITAAALNRDNSAFEQETGLELPDHLNLNVCRYLVVGDGYFGFKDLGDLRKKMGRFLGDQHDLLQELKGSKHTFAFEVFAKVRNLAAHQSDWAILALKKALKKHKVPGADGLTSAGAWLCAIDNSEPWRSTFGTKTGQARILGVRKYAESLGKIIEDKVGF